MVVRAPLGKVDRAGCPSWAQRGPFLISAVQFSWLLEASLGLTEAQEITHMLV